MKELEVRRKLANWARDVSNRRYRSGRQASHWSCYSLTVLALGDIRLYKLNNSLRNPDHPNNAVTAEIIGETVTFEWSKLPPSPISASRAERQRKLEEEREVAALKRYESLPTGYGGWA